MKFIQQIHIRLDIQSIEIYYKEWNVDVFNTVCGGVLVAKETNHRLFSHAKHGDQNYDNKMECEWHIVASPGHHVKFKFDTFEIEDESDCGSVIVQG